MELRHEAHSALLGIEAAVIGITANWHLMNPAEIDTLSAALASEVHRLHELLDRGADADAQAPSGFALLAAVESVITCARATDLTVSVHVPRRLYVHGIPGHAAQVVRSLLHNVRQHAPGSSVEITAVLEADHVSLRISDNGPGIGSELRRSIFDRGVRGDGSRGSGLGLYIAHRLMTEQLGSMSIDSGSGGGTTVSLRFRRPPVTERLYAVV